MIAHTPRMVLRSRLRGAVSTTVRPDLSITKTCPFTLTMNALICGSLLAINAKSILAPPTVSPLSSLLIRERTEYPARRSVASQTFFPVLWFHVVPVTPK